MCILKTTFKQSLIFLGFIYNVSLLAQDIKSNIIINSNNYVEQSTSHGALLITSLLEANLSYAFTFPTYELNFGSFFRTGYFYNKSIIYSEIDGTERYLSTKNKELQFGLNTNLSKEFKTSNLIIDGYYTKQLLDTRLREQSVYNSLTNLSHLYDDISYGTNIIHNVDLTARFSLSLQTRIDYIKATEKTNTINSQINTQYIFSNNDNLDNILGYTEQNIYMNNILVGQLKAINLSTNYNKTINNDKILNLSLGLSKNFSQDNNDFLFLVLTEFNIIKNSYEIHNKLERNLSTREHGSELFYADEATFEYLKFLSIDTQILFGTKFRREINTFRLNAIRVNENLDYVLNFYSAFTVNFGYLNVNTGQSSGVFNLIYNYELLFYTAYQANKYKISRNSLNGVISYVL